VRVASIARHTLLKLVGREVVDELSEDGSAEIHSLFSVGTTLAQKGGFALRSVSKKFKSKKPAFHLGY